MKVMTDNPINTIKDDKFGFGTYSDFLANAIKETDNLPFCIGVFGQWGTGKTSLMKLIEEEIKKENYKTIWFNPWKYDQKEDLWHSLIQTILYKIADESEDNDGIRKKAIDLASYTAWFFIKKGINFLTSGTISGDDLDKAKDAMIKQDEIHYRHINYFEKDFEDLVDKYTKQGKLIVFIDDLDRCLPENAITVLESLKLFIGNANCIFVLGMDHFIVEQGIIYKYKGQVNLSGRDYLDKIIQVPFFLPPVSFENLKTSLIEMFKQTDNLNFKDKIWKLIEIGLDGNPRQTKRFINCFALLRNVLKKPIKSSYNINDKNNGLMDIPEEKENFYLAKLLVIQMIFPDFYSHLKLYPNDWSSYEKLFDKNWDEREDIFNQNKLILKAFWENSYLNIFMDKTSDKKGFYEPPLQEIVSSLTKMISLVNPERNENKKVKS